MSWKHSKVGYKSVHKWIRNHKPRPKLCERCGKSPPREISNISGEHKRDINDYEWLCCPCHSKKDKIINNFKKGVR